MGRELGEETGRRQPVWHVPHHSVTTPLPLRYHSVPLRTASHRIASQECSSNPRAVRDARATTASTRSSRIPPITGGRVARDNNGEKPRRSIPWPCAPDLMASEGRRFYWPLDPHVSSSAGHTEYFPYFPTLTKQLGNGRQPRVLPAWMWMCRKPFFRRHSAFLSSFLSCYQTSLSKSMQRRQRTKPTMHAKQPAEWRNIYSGAGRSIRHPPDIARHYLFYHANLPASTIPDLFLSSSLSRS